jgi:hypothetical protein
MTAENRNKTNSPKRPRDQNTTNERHDPTPRRKRQGNRDTKIKTRDKKSKTKI